MAKRKIIRIDEELCNGCGDCVPSCAEGAIQIVDGKARLVSETFCDGLGACLGECPMGALTIEERDAPDFDEQAALRHAHRPAARPLPHLHGGGHVGGGCPSARVMNLGKAKTPAARSTPADAPAPAPALGHWPVKLRLVPPHAPFLAGAHLILAADCVPFAYPALHQEFLPGRAVVIGCPKFDDPEFTLERLTAILQQNDIASLTVLHMEVPCCHGYLRLAQEALSRSGKDIPLKQAVASVRGALIQP
jgi:NAD-dependent dihydropyrimidine dehydrogenase PreA subunit